MKVEEGGRKGGGKKMEEEVEATEEEARKEGERIRGIYLRRKEAREE